MAETAKELFEHELRDIYDAEHKLINALEKMAKDASDDQLSHAFKAPGCHTTATRRLERVFELVDRAPRREPCAGINGLIEEYQKFNQEEDASPEARDVFAAGTALKVETYEISAYKSLIKLANQLGLSDAVSLFEDSLREERETAHEAEEMSEILGKKLP
jgi:ferritin-like metal-binding protein YciE